MRQQLSRTLAVIIAISCFARAGTINGQLQTPTSGTINNGTLNFTLSQPAIVSGTASVIPSSVSCYTDNGGNIVGVPDPQATPVLSANYASGTLAAGTYYVKLTYYNTSGQSSPGPEGIFTLTSQGTLIVNAPTLQPAAATGYKVYISTATITETLQGTVIGWASFSQLTSLAAGAVLPVSNTSACSFRFSDEMIPSGTYYTVNLLNKNGSQIAGYPQTWCTYGGSGGSINVSSGSPTGLCNVIYPTPIVAVPPGNAAQSISGPLSLTQPLTLTGGGTLAGNFVLNGPTAGTPSTLNGANFYYFSMPSTSHGEEDSMMWGKGAGSLLTSSACASCDYGNILIGFNAGHNLGSTTPDTDVEITAIGDQALANTHGSLAVTAIGRAAGTANTTGLGSATIMGHFVMGNNTTGGGLGTVAIGDSAGAGNYGGTSCTTGCADAVFVGEGSGLGSGASQVNTIAAFGPRAWVNCTSCGDLGGTILPLNWGINNPNPLFPFSPMIQVAKATAATTGLAFFSTNDSSNPFGLEMDITGAAALANRSVTLQTKDVSLSIGGTLNLQTGGGTVLVGSGNAAMQIGSTDTGVSRLAGGVIGAGNGSNGDGSGEFRAAKLTSTVATGTAPLTVTSTTAVANLTVQLGNNFSSNQLTLTAAAPTVAAAQVGFGSTTATTATAGTNGAVPAQVSGYLIINVAGTAAKIPYFNN